MAGAREAGEIGYHCQDFEWENLRQEIENSPASLRRNAELCRSDESEEIDAAQDAWQQFHQRHSKGLFFKERRYLLKEFPELSNQVESMKVLEVGCGNGSTIIPLLKANKAAIVYACDLSIDALKAVSQQMDAAGMCALDSARLKVFCCDLSTRELPSWLCCASCRTSFIPCSSLEKASCVVVTHNISQHVHHTLQKDLGLPKNAGASWSLESTINYSSIGNSNYCYNKVVLTEGSEEGCKEQSFQESLEMGSLSSLVGLSTSSCCVGGVDKVTMIFTLSAVPVLKMLSVLREIFAVLRPGGALLFRDYGLYDMTMLRFPPSQQVADRLYRRLDGTLAYYFSCEEVRKLFTSVGFMEEDIQYCCVQLFNRKRNLPMKRVWVHGRFVKP